MARVKKKSHERLTDTNVQHVIDLLRPKEKDKKPITKKEACNLLNIAYNTTRLQKIIDEYEERKAFVARRKAENKGKRASKSEIAQCITETLQGESIAAIAKSLFRSPGFVNGVLNRVGVPRRGASASDRSKVGWIPERCISERFVPTEIVWSAKYHAPAVIKKELPYDERYLGHCYQIYVIEQIDSSESFFPFIERGGFNAFCPFYDLGKLEHLEQFGIDLKNIS